MIARFRAWLRWVLKTDWIYTGSTIARSRSEEYFFGRTYIEKHWLNVHTGEVRRTFGGWGDLRECDR